MTNLTTKDRPERVAFDLSDRQVVFVRVGEDRYAAELDGKRLPIRTKRQNTDIYDGGTLHSYEPTTAEGNTANIDAILLCLARGADSTPLPLGVRLEASDNWGHFRQNTFLKIAITIAESSLLEINEDIQEMDCSYY